MMRQTIFEKRKRQTPKMTFVFVLKYNSVFGFLFLCAKLIVKEVLPMIKQIKAHLNKSIQSILGQKVELVKQDEQAFTRKRRLSLETMIRTILGMGGKSLSKELLDARLTVSNSAFVQRRYQIKPEAFYTLFKEFTAPIPLNTNLPIFVVKRITRCQTDSFKFSLCSKTLSDKT